MIKQLIAEAKRSFERFGFIQTRVRILLENMNINVAQLEQNWGSAR